MSEFFYNGKYIVSIIISDIITTPIANLRIWRCDSWVKYDFESTKVLLRVYYDLLIITADDKILESINFVGKVKGILKDDILILIINVSGQEIRKIKFKMCTNIRKYVTELRSCFPVVNYNSVVSKHKAVPKYLKINDLLKQAFQDKDDWNVNKIALPEDYSNFVKLCLLDPKFPQIVHETEKIVREQVLGDK